VSVHCGFKLRECESQAAPFQVGVVERLTAEVRNRLGDGGGRFFREVQGTVQVGVVVTALALQAPWHVERVPRTSCIGRRVPRKDPPEPHQA